MATKRRLIVTNWSATPPVIGVLFGLLGIAFVLYLLLPTLPPWRDPDPRQYFLVPSLTALLFLYYFAIILSLMGLAISARIAWAYGSPIHWWALPVIVVPPFIWLVLVMADSTHMGWGNALELPLLGFMVAVFLNILGGSVRTWRSGAYGTWFMCIAALLLWAYVPRWA